MGNPEIITALMQPEAVAALNGRIDGAMEFATELVAGLREQRTPEAAIVDELLALHHGAVYAEAMGHAVAELTEAMYKRQAADLWKLIKSDV